MRSLLLLSATLAVALGSWGRHNQGYGRPSFKSYQCWEKPSYGRYNNNNNYRYRYKRDSGYGYGNNYGPPSYGPPPSTTLECGQGYDSFTCQLQGGSSYGPPSHGPGYGNFHNFRRGSHGGRNGDFGPRFQSRFRGNSRSHGGGYPRHNRWKRDSGYGYGGPQEQPCKAGYNTLYCTKERGYGKPRYHCVDKNSGGGYGGSSGGGYGGDNNNNGGYGGSSGGGYGGSSGGYGGSGHDSSGGYGGSSGGYGGDNSGGYHPSGQSSYQHFNNQPSGYGPGQGGGGFNGNFGKQFSGYNIGFGLEDVDRKGANADDTNANNCKRECFLDKYHKQNCRMKCCNWQCPHVCITKECCDHKFPPEWSGWSGWSGGNKGGNRRRKRDTHDNDNNEISDNEKCLRSIISNKKKCKFSCYVKMENLDQKQGKYYVSETYGNLANTDQHSAQNAFHTYSKFYKNPEEEHPNLAASLISKGVKGAVHGDGSDGLKGISDDEAPSYFGGHIPFWWINYNQ